jgi:hypothetical protein
MAPQWRQLPVYSILQAAYAAIKQHLQHELICYRPQPNGCTLIALQAEP